MLGCNLSWCCWLRKRTVDLSLARPRDVLARLGTSWQRHDMSWQRCLDSGWWDGVEATVGAVCTVGGVCAVRTRDAKKVRRARTVPRNTYRLQDCCVFLLNFKELSCLHVCHAKNNDNWSGCRIYSMIYKKENYEKPSRHTLYQLDICRHLRYHHSWRSTTSTLIR